MADTAVIADPHVRVGIVAGDGGTAIWPLLVGPAQAKQYLLTGDPVDAAAAERHRARERGGAGGGAPGAGRDGGPSGWPPGPHWRCGRTKAAVNAQVKRALIESFDLATALELSTFQSDDHAEALAALEERRPPQFKGR